MSPSTPASPTDEIRITLRLPTPLRDSLTAAAAESSRSMNGEIIHRLSEYDVIRKRLAETEKLLADREQQLFAGRVELRRVQASMDAAAELVDALPQIPHDILEGIRVSAAENNRTVGEEMVDRLRESKRYDDLIESLLNELQRSVDEQRYTAEVLKWMAGQQQMSFRMLEAIARTDGNLGPDLMDALRVLVETRGENTGFPEKPADKSDE